jgi:protoporphyrinogen oxidase
MAAAVAAAGGEVRLGARVDRLRLAGGGVAAVRAGGEEIACAAVVSSLPVGTVARAARPAPGPEVLAAARGLRHRDFLTVALVLDGPPPFPDTWIYIHDPQVRVGRIQNFLAWSPWMVPEPGRSCVGLEYFCFRGDELWSMGDEDLVDLAAGELGRLGLGDPRRVAAGHVVRVPRAYPIYDAGYAERLATLRGWLDTVPNLVQVGRNGLHRYNNSDHSMLTAMRAVENLLDGAAHDVWAVNADSAYHEEGGREEPPYRDAPAAALAEA